MKFVEDLDAKLFGLEIGLVEDFNNLDKSFTPTNEQMDLFLSKRRKLESALKNKKQSSAQKSNWRANRYKMMKGIKAFHRSTDGKRFHRSLGNFLATRFTGNDHGRPENRNKTNENVEFLKGLNSAKTHLYIELEYYHQVYEQIELEDLAFNYAHSLMNIIEDKVIKGQDLNEDELLFLYDITETIAIIKSFAEKSGKKVSEVEKMWKGIKKGLIDDGKKEEDEDFYKLLVGILKKQLNLT